MTSVDIIFFLFGCSIQVLAFVLFFKNTENPMYDKNEISLFVDIALMVVKFGVSILCIILSLWNRQKIRLIFKSVSELDFKLLTLKIQKNYKKDKRLSILFLILSLFILIIISYLFQVCTLDYFTNYVQIMQICFGTLGLYTNVVFMGQATFLLLLLRNNFKDVNFLFR